MSKPFVNNLLYGCKEWKCLFSKGHVNEMTREAAS